jgi:hypothetical protein
MFSNVLKKFFTCFGKNENKVATNDLSRSHPMFTQIKNTIRNSRSTLVQDAAGAGALVVMMLVALHLPGFA